MKKITFIIVFISIGLLIAYSYFGQREINHMIESIPPVNQDVVKHTPPTDEVRIDDIFMNKPIDPNAVPENILIAVGPEYVSCTGVVEMECMMVDGRLFYDQIVGFEYEPGFMYQLEVKQIFRKEPIPADLGSWYYELISVVSKDAPYTGTELSDVSWQWQSYVDEGVLMAPDQPERFVLNFDSEGSVSGTTDCNNYFGSYTVTQTSLSIGPLASTLMACFESQEALYHNLLDAIGSYMLDGDILVLTGVNENKMTFIAKEKND